MQPLDFNEQIRRLEELRENKAISESIYVKERLDLDRKVGLDNNDRNFFVKSIKDWKVTIILSGIILLAIVLYFKFYPLHPSKDQMVSVSMGRVFRMIEKQHVCKIVVIANENLVEVTIKRDTLKAAIEYKYYVIDHPNFLEGGPQFYMTDVNIDSLERALNYLQKDIPLKDRLHIERLIRRW